MGESDFHVLLAEKMRGPGPLGSICQIPGYMRLDDARQRMPAPSAICAETCGVTPPMTLVAIISGNSDSSDRLPPQPCDVRGITDRSTRSRSSGRSHNGCERRKRKIGQPVMEVATAWDSRCHVPGRISRDEYR